MDRQKIDIVKAFYDENFEGEWDRLEKEPFEFELTTYMMDKHVKPGDRILDLGGGPGRYSLYYAKKGCDVTLVDLSEGNVAFARKKAEEEGVSFAAHAANCLDIESLQLGVFDHVFLMGPLYHLEREADREAAVRAALTCLKPGGLLYISFILLTGAIIYDLCHAGILGVDLSNPDGLRLMDCLENGGDYEGPAFTSACFMNQHNILPFMARFPLKTLHLFGQESFLAPNKHELVKRDAEELENWLMLAKRFIELPEFLSWSEHAMYIGEKTSENEGVL